MHPDILSDRLDRAKALKATIHARLDGFSLEWEDATTGENLGFVSTIRRQDRPRVFKTFETVIRDARARSPVAIEVITSEIGAAQ